MCRPLHLVVIPDVISTSVIDDVDVVNGRRSRIANGRLLRISPQSAVAGRRKRNSGHLRFSFHLFRVSPGFSALRKLFRLKNFPKRTSSSWIRRPQTVRVQERNDGCRMSCRPSAVTRRCSKCWIHSSRRSQNAKLLVVSKEKGESFVKQPPPLAIATQRPTSQIDFELWKDEPLD